MEVDTQPYDPSRPVVCVAEAGKPWIGEVREPLRVRPQSPAKSDSEYQREGMANARVKLKKLYPTIELQ